jgi:GST-like protein
MSPLRLYCVAGCGSMIVEAALALAGIEPEYIDLAPAETGWESAVLAPLNPLGQAPTLVLPGGAVMTESAAIILYISEKYPEAGLAPPTDDPARARFLRWLVFLASAVYPTFTYADKPARWTGGDEQAGGKLRAQTMAHREKLYRQMEDDAGAPWFLGQRFSALDLYLWQMSHWRPRRPWFAAQCPRLYAIATRADGLSACRKTAARNGFPPE